MEKVLVAKDLTANKDIEIEIPSTILVAGDKLSGKTFLVRQLIDKQQDKRIVLLTNRPDSYHGLKEHFVVLDKSNHHMEIKDQLTVLDASVLYDDDPEHVLDSEIAHLGELIQEGDILIVDEVYPYLDDELDKWELFKTIEVVRAKNATVILTTNQEHLLLEEGPVLLKMSDYFFCLRQSRQTAIKLCEAYAGEPGRYELLRYFDAFDFGKGMFFIKEGDISFVQIV